MSMSYVQAVCSQFTASLLREGGQSRSCVEKLNNPANFSFQLLLHSLSISR